MRIISLLLALMVIAGCSGTGSNETAEPPEASVSSEAAQSTAPQASPADTTADFTGKYRKSPRRFRMNIQDSYIWMPFS